MHDRIRDIIDTSNMTGLSCVQVEGFMKDYTHSEIRMGQWKNNKFTPGDFIEAFYKKIDNNCMDLLTPKNR